MRQLFYLVLDGLGDEPCTALGGRTPLAVARTPVLDALATKGANYRLDMRDRNGAVSTSYGQLSLFGYGDDLVLPERGPIEAAGIGVQLQGGEVAFRANWATLDRQGNIVDRRAGRIREGAAELSRALDGLDLGDGVRAVVRNGTEHRVALVLCGQGLGASVTDIDPQLTADEPIAPLPLRAIDPNDEWSMRTVRKLSRFLELARPILERHPVNGRRIDRGLPPANTLLTRCAGGYVKIPTLQERFGIQGMAVTGGSTVMGVMQLLGTEVVRMPRFTANVDTDLRGKLEEAIGGLASGHCFVMVHVKAMDILAHDRRPEEGVRYLEKIDAEIERILPFLPRESIFALGADHSTSSQSGDHTTTPPPAFISGPGIEADGVTKFDEFTLAKGAPKVRGSVFFHRILTALGRRPAQDTPARSAGRPSNPDSTPSR